MSRPDLREARIIRWQDASSSEVQDLLAVEEPLEIRIRYEKDGKTEEKNISITMRTPGTDADLAIGFLYTEGIINNQKDVENVAHLEKIPGLMADENVIIITLKPGIVFDQKKLERNFYTTSSCGVCGKASIDAIRTVSGHKKSIAAWSIDKNLIQVMPELLRKAQDNFESTGGLHASAIFDLKGNLLGIREDVGRHNALDKLIGYFLQQGQMPLDNHVLLLSGRASFELLQKAAMAGIQMVCAVGAPSSLAVETAAEFGITLVGFLKKDRFNIYTYGERIK